jgi:hypothetical protein
MSPTIVTCAVTLALSIFPSSRLQEGSAHPSYPPTATLEEVREWVERAPTTHPRLLSDREGLIALRESIERDPLRAKIAEVVVLQAEALLEEAPIKRELVGRRLLSQSRRCIQRVLGLSMAYHLTGEMKYVRRCEEELLAVARFEDWNPSHFLDVGEMTFGLAIGYDWLYDQLDPEAREEIRDAIVKKGVTLPLENPGHWWVKGTNNWGQVCHGGLVAGALAVMEHEPEIAARTVHSAISNVTHSMAVYEPKGSYPEGPGYWGYGTGFNVLLIASLESVLSTDFGLSLAPGFDETGAYPCLMTGTSGRYFNYADGGWKRGPQPALFWFAARYGRPDWLFGEVELLDKSLDRLRERPERAGRLAPLSLLWMAKGTRAVAAAKVELPLHWRGGGDVPITIHRSSWSDPDAVFVTVKAGSPSANHGHMDIGSFVLDADGVRWSHDLGAEGYHGIESRGMDLWNRSQDSDRWKIFRLNNHSHSTLVIDGELQQVGGRGEVVRFSDDLAGAFTVVDLAGVHAAPALRHQRGVALLPSNQVIIQDELRGLKPGTRVRWGMLTLGKPGDDGKPGRDGEESIELTQGDASLSLTLASPRGAAAAWKVIDTETSRNEWDSPNPGTAMVAFEAVAPESGELILCVWITPGSCANPALAPAEPIPIEEW